MFHDPEQRNSIRRETSFASPNRIADIFLEQPPSAARSSAAKNINGIIHEGREGKQKTRAEKKKNRNHKGAKKRRNRNKEKQKRIIGLPLLSFPRKRESSAHISRKQKKHSTAEDKKK
jgi:hypothetical protein